MQPTEYVFTVPGGWRPLAANAFKLPPLVAEDALGDVLYTLGYLLLGHNAGGRCGLGHFLVWQCQKDRGRLPRYALEIDQAGDPGVVWIATLPGLWDFLRLYGAIGFHCALPLPGDEEDEEDEEGFPPSHRGPGVVLPFGPPPLP